MTFTNVSGEQLAQARVNANKNAKNRSVDPRYSSDRSTAVVPSRQCRNSKKEQFEGVCNFYVETARAGFTICQGCADARSGANR